MLMMRGGGNAGRVEEPTIQQWSAGEARIFETGQKTEEATEVLLVERAIITMRGDDRVMSVVMFTIHEAIEKRWELREMSDGLPRRAELLALVGAREGRVVC